MKQLILIFICVLMAACGQYGGLYLPKEPAQQTAKQQGQQR